MKNGAFTRFPYRGWSRLPESKRKSIALSSREGSRVLIIFGGKDPHLFSLLCFSSFRSRQLIVALLQAKKTGRLFRRPYILDTNKGGCSISCMHALYPACTLYGHAGFVLLGCCIVRLVNVVYHYYCSFLLC